MSPHTKKYIFSLFLIKFREIPVAGEGQGRGEGGSKKDKDLRGIQGQRPYSWRKFCFLTLKTYYIYIFYAQSCDLDEWKRKMPFLGEISSDSVGTN